MTLGGREDVSETTPDVVEKGKGEKVDGLLLLPEHNAMNAMPAI